MEKESKTESAPTNNAPPGRPLGFDADEALEKAMRLFWRKGYKAVSVQDLVDATGLNRSSLYNTYGEKRQLFLLALAQYVRTSRARSARFVEEQGGGVGAIRALFEGVVEEATAGESACFVVNATTELALHDADVAQIVGDNLLANEQMFVQMLKNAQMRGETSADKDTKSLALFFVNAMHGLRVTAQATQDRETLENIVAVTLSVLGDSPTTATTAETDN